MDGHTYPPSSVVFLSWELPPPPCAVVLECTEHNQLEMLSKIQREAGWSWDPTETENSEREAAEKCSPLRQNVSEARQVDAPRSISIAFEVQMQNMKSNMKSNMKFLYSLL